MSTAVFLERNYGDIKMARQFCNFSNPEWVDQKLGEFKTKLEKAKLASK